MATLRTINEMHNERELGLQNLTNDQRDAINNSMNKCSFCVSAYKTEVTKCMDKIIELLKDENIKQYSPKLSKMVDGLQIIIEQIDIVNGMAWERI